MSWRSTLCRSAGIPGAAAEMADAGGEGRSLLRSGFSVAALGALSRVLGLVRDVLVAILLGVSPGTDVFFLSLSVAQLMRGLAMEGPLFQSQVSVFSECRLRGGDTRVRALLARLITAEGSLVLALVLPTLLLPVLLVAVFAAGFFGDTLRYSLAEDMLRGAFLYLLPISLAGIAAAAQNSARHFIAPAFTPVLFNLVLLGALYAAAEAESPFLLLALAIPAAGLVQLLFQTVCLNRLGLLSRPAANFRDPDFHKMLSLSGAALLTVMSTQANVPINNFIASFLPVGSISWLNYAVRLCILPVGLIGVAAATVLIPSLAERHIRADRGGFATLLGSGIRVVLLLGVPAGAGIALLAEPIATTLFQYGRLDATDASRIARALRLLALGVPASMLVTILAGACFARRDARTPIRTALLLLPISLAIKLPLVLFLHRQGFGYLGLALGVSIASWLNVALLWRPLRRAGVLPAAAALLPDLLRAAVALGAMSLCLYALGAFADAETALPWHERSLWLAAFCLGGALSYFAALFLAGVRPRLPG